MGSLSFPADGAIPALLLIQLKSLSLSFHRSAINPQIVNNLSFTQLHALRFASKCVDHPELWHDTLAFWQKIQKLEELGIYGSAAMNLIHLLSLLLNAWNVTRLELQIGVSPSEIFGFTVGSRNGNM